MAPELRYDVVNGITYTYVNGVPGPLNDVDARTLIEYAAQLPEGARYVEVGSYLGCSALLIALHSKAKVWAHDLWVSDWSQLKGDPPPLIFDCYAKFLTSVRENGVEEQVTPVRGDSAHTLKMHDDGSIDLGFVDGDHSYEGCMRDLEIFHPKMKQGGYLLVHDCLLNSPPLRATAEFANRHNISGDIVRGSTGMAILRY